MPFAPRARLGVSVAGGSVGAVWEALLPIAPGEGGCEYVTELTKASAKPNKPKRLKMLVINKIARKAEKQTHASYQPCYQSLTAVLALILKKYEWNYERSCDVLYNLQQ